MKVEPIINMKDIKSIKKLLVDLGKHHDKSFGRGELGKAKAEAFEQAVQEANEKLLPIPDPETVTAGIRVAAKAAEVRTETTAPPANQVIEKEPTGITLSELGKKYLDHMRASGRTEKHIRNVERLLDNQFVPVIGDKPVDALTYQGTWSHSFCTSRASAGAPARSGPSTRLTSTAIT